MFFRILPLPLGTNAVHKQNWYRLSIKKKLKFKTVQIIYGESIDLMQEEHLVWVTVTVKLRSLTSSYSKKNYYSQGNKLLLPEDKIENVRKI